MLPVRNVVFLYWGLSQTTASRFLPEVFCKLNFQPGALSFVQMYSLLLESLYLFTKFCFQNLKKPNWYLSFMFVSHWFARTHSSGKDIANSVTACTVLFQLSMLPVISKQQLDFVFQKYMQINFKYLWEIKVAFLQNLYLQSYLNIWNYLVYWERFRPTVQLYSSGVCSVWDHLRDVLCELFAEPHCFRDCTSIIKALLGLMFTGTQPILWKSRDFFFLRSRILYCNWQISWSSWALGTGR